MGSRFMCAIIARNIFAGTTQLYTTQEDISAIILIDAAPVAMLKFLRSVYFLTNNVLTSFLPLLYSIRFLYGNFL